MQPSLGSGRESCFSWIFGTLGIITMTAMMPLSLAQMAVGSSMMKVGEGRTPTGDKCTHPVAGPPQTNAETDVRAVLS